MTKILLKKSGRKSILIVRESTSEWDAERGENVHYA